MPNPFSLDLTQGSDPTALQGLTDTIAGIGQINRQKREKEALIQQEQKTQAEMQAAIETGDPAKISEFMRKNPKHAESVKQSMGFEDEMVKTQAVDFMTGLLSSPEDQWTEKFKNRIDTLESQGRDPSETVKVMQAWANNPAQGKKAIETILAVSDQDAFDAYQEATVEEVDYSPLQKKIAAEGIDPNTPEGFARAKELNQRAATDPSLRPSDQQVLLKANDAQLLSAGFANRVRSANDALSTLEATEGFDPASLGASIARDIPGGNYVISQDHQDYFQAKDDFVTAVLRKESGAVISDTEFAREDRKYFPQPGDKASVIKKKSEARERAFQNLRNASKGVYDIQSKNPDLYGDPEKSSGQESIEDLVSKYAD